MRGYYSFVIPHPVSRPLQPRQPTAQASPPLARRGQTRRPRIVRVLVEVIEPLRMKGAGPPDQAVDRIALGKQQLGQVRPVLAGDPGDEGGWHVDCPFTSGRGRLGSVWRNLKTSLRIGG